MQHQIRNNRIINWKWNEVPAFYFRCCELRKTRNNYGMVVFQPGRPGYGVPTSAS
jgi:hypothetical protein